MAATTTAFETEINAGSFSLTDRGLMAGAAYKLRQLYLAGNAAGAPTHALAKSNARHVAALTANSKLTSFDAITAP